MRRHAQQRQGHSKDALASCGTRTARYSRTFKLKEWLLLPLALSQGQTNPFADVRFSELAPRLEHHRRPPPPPPPTGPPMRSPSLQ